ncbi:MAG: ThiF family adenylyltransferase [Bacteroidales bacterium]|nr:ThiF family adenylyltransferase [Bacteroidales bacterium]
MKNHQTFNPQVEYIAISPGAFSKMRDNIGGIPAESGGALFGKPEQLRSSRPYITEFVFDKSAKTSRATYSIDAETLNPIIHKMWDEKGLELQGIVHSHPRGFNHPSGPDMEYFHKMHTYMDRPFIITPIIYTQPDGGFELMCYIVGPDSPAIRVDYRVMTEEEYAKAAENQPVSEIDYSREAGAVDVNYLKDSKIVITGTGGYYEGAAMLARCGVGEIIAIDPDIVDATNLCRQGYLPRQVGMNKVDALGEHLKEINPNVKYSGYAVKLQDLTPELEAAIFSNARLAIFTTDSFEAQARGNIISQRYHIPAIWGGFYNKSFASEIVFYIPGVTPGCYRCAVSPRYKAQEAYRASNNGAEYSVSSNCNTIFHSALLDAQIGMLAMAILHNHIEGKTFSGWFGYYFDRNLIQMNVNPAYRSDVFSRAFGLSGGYAYLFDSVWQHIDPEIPPKYALCPDCGGGVQSNTGEKKQAESCGNTNK